MNVETTTDDDRARAERRAAIERVEREIRAEKRRRHEEGHWERMVRLQAELDRLERGETP